jgi:Na+/H+ antiporter NhaC
MSEERSALLADLDLGGVDNGDLPGRPRRSVVVSIVAAALIFLVILGIWLSFDHTSGLGGWYRIVPPLVAIVAALITAKLHFSLISGVIAGGLLSAAHAGGGFFSWLWSGCVQSGEFVVKTVHKSGGFNLGNLNVMLFITMLMVIINIMIAGGGLQGIAAWMLKRAKSARSTRMVTMFSGLMIFIDDYANTLIVGPAMRPLTDRQKISREKLAFLVDATAAPIAGIALVSTWVAFEVRQLSDPELGIGLDGYAVLLNSLGFRFYCFGMIAFVFWNCWTGADFGPMAAAERRARAGKVLADDAVPMTSKSMNAAGPHSGAKISALVAIVPMLVLLGVFLGQFWLSKQGLDVLGEDPLAIVRLSGWTAAMKGVSSSTLLAWAALAGLVTAITMALATARIPLMALVRAIGVGLRNALMPLTVLILAWSLKNACLGLKTGDFLAKAWGDSLSPMLFPGLVFVTAACISFATGTSYGTMTILIPTVVPVAMALEGDYGLITMISIGAILDGAIFGDHCSPISDTTIMSSIGSSCDHVHHVRTQLPYCIVVAVLALGLGYVPAAMGVSPWIGIAAGAGASGLIFLGLRVFRRSEGTEPQ